MVPVPSATISYMISPPFLPVLAKLDLCLQDFSQDSFTTWAGGKMTDD
jgi:hypothetical protein